MNKEQAVKPGDLELMYNLFQPHNAHSIKSVISPFKLAFVGAILFGLLSLPFVSKILELWVRNPILGKLALMFVFLIVFFLLQKLFLKM